VFPLMPLIKPEENFNICGNLRNPCQMQAGAGDKKVPADAADQTR